MNILKKIERKITRYINLKPSYINLNEAVISFTFDDFPKSAATIAADILQKYNFTATYYCVGDFVGTVQDNVQQYDKNDIRRLINDGHEIACHTSTHIDCQSTSNNELARNIENNEKIIIDLCGQKPSNFSYPYGMTGLRSKLLAGKKFITARGILGGLNNNLCDFSQLKANPIYSRGNTIDEIRSLIKNAVDKKAWLIFYTHDVTENPSAYGCTPEFFEEVVKIVSESKCKVLPIKRAVSYLTYK